MLKQFDEVTQTWVEMSSKAYEEVFGHAPAAMSKNVPIGAAAVQAVYEESLKNEAATRNFARGTVDAQSDMAHWYASQMGLFNNEFTAHLFRSFNLFADTYRVACLTVLDKTKPQWPLV